MTSESTYGFIGVGVMGWGMAMNIRQKLPRSSNLIVCEVSEARRDQFVAQAGTKGPVETAATPREVAAQADVIITMLPSSEHVHSVFKDENSGLLSVQNRGGKLHLIDCSTISVSTSTKVGEEVAQSGLGTFIDAPVSGGPNGANGGTLTLMVGGSRADFDFAESILKMMGKSVFFCGPPGAGLATKQINNYLSSVCTVGVCEAMNMGVKYGLDPKVLAGVINVSSGRCYNSLEQNPVKGVTPGAASETDFVGGFSVEMCRSVLGMAVDLGKNVGAQSVLSGPILGVYDKAVKDERTRGLDSRSVYRLFADDSMNLD